MATIQIPDKLVREIEDLREAGLAVVPEDFAQQAIREKLRGARQGLVEREARPLRDDLASAGVTEEMLLEEFDRFRHAAHARR
jgi:Arc/MetJ-type ribon-helix-helix transcriptional regulator